MKFARIADPSARQALAARHDPIVGDDREEEQMRLERDEIDQMIAELWTDADPEDLPMSCRVELGDSKRRIVRLRPVRRSHDPHTTHPSTYEEAA